MFRLIPAPLHRIILRTAHAFRVWWWRLRRPQIEGVSLIISDEAGRILLVRQTYGARRWSLPGGGLQSGEQPHDGAMRELAEELGCQAAELALLQVTEGELHGAPSRVHLFTGRLHGTPEPDGREISDVGLYHPDTLPEPLDRRVRPWLALLPA